MADTLHSSWIEKKKVLVVEDHPFTRMGIAEFINRQHDLEICGLAEDVREALLLADAKQPDLILTDLSLPGRGGLELIKDLYALYPKIPVLVLSMYDEPLYAERVLRMGARGYITKWESPEQLLDAIRRVLRGKLYLSEEMAAHAIEYFAGHVSPQSALSVGRLTDRELEVFRKIGMARSSREIAGDCGISIKTVETHVGNIKQKFGVATLRELSRLAVCWMEEQRVKPSDSSEGMTGPVYGVQNGVAECALALRPKTS
ncbi:response regulator transcription factor [Verrucomicrobiota bacterium sgz303538]